MQKSKLEPRYSALENRGEFSGLLVDWFGLNGKDLPWRQTEDPYAILVSELMLQQTQVATVLQRDYFGRWMSKFPDISSLAAADEASVLKAWEGLGYYSRARRLRSAAIFIQEELGGVFPETADGILKLPGVGRYTAGAVATFAYGHSVPIVDANVTRVFARLFDFHELSDSAAGIKQMWDWAEALVPKENAREYNSALMELGQTVCRLKNPACELCPVAKFCHCIDPHALPQKKAKQAILEVNEHVGYAVKGDAVFLEMESGSRRNGLWRLPELGEGEWEDLPVMYEMKYAITRYRVKLLVHRLSADDLGKSRENGKWVGMGEELEEIAMGSPYRRALREVWDGANLLD